MSERSLITTRLKGSLEAIAALREQADRIRDLSDAVADRLRAGGILYTAGNGGSAAQAIHLTEELIGRYRGDRPPQPAVCLNADASVITCIANDYGYDQVFARQCTSLVSQRDVLLVLSTSGESQNVVEALRVARSRGAVTIGLLGNDGGRCAPLCDHVLIVPSDDSAHIQEAHQVAIHLICEVVEKRAVSL
ncbi:MAG: D-sedoheptulose-7-phosphate isomerase [Planctomycetota bacterium]|jgi:D-sedoheptulose 7-phosphate isomerase